MAVTTTNLGVITAYGDAVAAGYTGTKAEWQTLMASYATVAEDANEAKDDAVAAKNAAVDAKNAAVQAKDTAVAAKDTATSKATEATTAANTATTKANEASASAQSIAQSASQIAQNTSDISELKEDLTDKADTVDMLKAFPTDTASGAVASFSDGANLPVKSLIVNIDPVQSGSGDPSPTNVRPISGWSEVNVQRTGKNLLDDTQRAFSYNAVYFGGATGQDTGGYVTLPKGTYTYSVENIDGSVTSLYARDLDNNPIAGFPAYNVNTKTFTLDKETGIRFWTYKNSYTSINDVKSAQVEVGSTATPYEPYNGTSLNISLGQTVYGGTLDVVSGELVIDRAMVDLGTLNWLYVADSACNMRTSDIVDAAPTKSSNVTPNAICSNLPVLDYLTLSTPVDGITVVFAQSAQAGKIWAHSGLTDASAFKAAMDGAQFCYELATPLTIQLTPHEVTALLGSNNVWADTGDTEVTYRADPTLYINRLTEPDADMIADANITSGQYFMVGNTLYKATANIASGATISPNVNCTRKSLSEALNEINA